MIRRMPRLSVAPNGARHGKAQHPALPVTIDDLVTCAQDCLAAGAGGIHLHVRDGNGVHVLDAALFNRAAEAVDRATGGAMWVQATSEAVGRFTPADQCALLAGLRTPAVSVALRELIPDAAHESAAAAALAEVTGRGVAVQYILFNPAEIAWFQGQVARGVVPDVALDVLFAVGHYTIGDSEPALLAEYVATWRDSPVSARAEWMVCGFGITETAVIAGALALGGKARVGFENSFLNADGTTARDNADRVARIKALIDALGQSIPAQSIPAPAIPAHP
jgi:3-keto-5-aminohexanoate cleavage enzyme